MIVQMCAGDKEGRVSLKPQKLHCALYDLDAFRSLSGDRELQMLAAPGGYCHRAQAYQETNVSMRVCCLGVRRCAHMEKQNVI